MDTAERRLTVLQGQRTLARFPISVGRDNPLLPARPDAMGPGPLTRLTRVQPGDTLWALARRYTIDVWTLRTLNPAVDARRLRPGARLRVPRRHLQLTPLGVFKVTNKTRHPIYRTPDEILPPYPQDPRNAFGVRWIGLSNSPYGIHGTNAPETIGGFNSRGCIRLRNGDVVRLFDMVHLGTAVRIR